MTPPYVPLETIQLLSKTSFSKIKNKKVIWGGTLKWDTLYNIITYLKLEIVIDKGLQVSLSQESLTYYQSRIISDLAILMIRIT